MLTTVKTSIQKIVLTALMMALIVVMTFIIRVPVPATNGYIHLGDCMIFLAVLLLGWKFGAIAAGLGSAMADIFGGYAHYAPITLVVKGLMAVAVGLFIEWALKGRGSSIKLKIMGTVGMVIGGGVMVAGYYVAESVMYGSWVTPLAAIPMNILQFVVGVILAMALATALYKTSAKKIFEYNVVGK